MASTRRLTAILAADVAGYSRLMGADEEGTLAALKTLRSYNVSQATISRLIDITPDQRSTHGFTQ
jgi:class 3 adenylate cyclase